jgi:hypothetical protein
MIPTENVQARSVVTIWKYRNDEMTEWVSGSFKTELERSAAWATFAHICNEYPEAGKIIRGHLVDSGIYEG